MTTNPEWRTEMVCATYGHPSTVGFAVWNNGFVLGRAGGVTVWLESTDGRFRAKTENGTFTVLREWAATS